MDSELKCVVKEIDELIFSDSYPDKVLPYYLKDAVFSYFYSGGKRLRAALLLWCNGLFGGDLSKAKYCAAAVEVYHTWTLVHDDVIDDDDVRRGAPTAHIQLRSYAEDNFSLTNDECVKFGQDMAILAGDIQQGWANSLILKSKKLGVSSEVILSILGRLQEMVNVKLISGEALDVEFSYRDFNSISYVDVYEMLKLKTGVLFQFAAETGAMLAFEEEDYLESRIKSIGEFAVNAGVAFQMQDDILGVFADESVLGKPICSDFSEAKPTLLFYKTMELLDSAASEEFKSFMGKKNLTLKDIDRIRELIILAGADKVILTEAKNIVDKSKEILATLPYNKYSELLVEWVDYLVGRCL